MTMLQNANAISAGGYDINNSLRFRSSASAYLNRTPASAGDRQKFTISVWIKRGTLSTEQAIITQGSGNRDIVRINPDNTLFFYWYDAANYYAVSTTQVFRDPSAWYHIVVAVDTTQATASNRVKLYVNGTQVTALTSTSYPNQNYSFTYWNTTNASAIGKDIVANNAHLDGYMAEFHFIDGSQKAASDFGSTDTTTGVWKPKAYSGTYGTNGFYLKFSDIATTSGSNAGLGKDFSGNTNYWTTNNISVTSGTTYDAMIDSPTNTSATVANYCTINPLLDLQTYATYSEGNLKIATTASTGFSMRMHSKGTMSIPSSGKWYFAANASDCGVIIGSDDPNRTQYGSSVLPTNVRYQSTGDVLLNSNSYATVASFTITDEVGFAIDMDALTVGIYKNGSLLTTVTGVTSGFTYYPMTITNSSSTAYTAYWNFGQRPFSYTPPSGYKTLNTYNLPDSTIKKGNSYMNTVLYTGNGSTQSITGVGFSPDFIWIKERSSTSNPQIHDSIRGAYILYTNLTNAEEADGGWDSFDADGYSMFGGNNGINESGQTYVSWNWRGSDSSAVSNTDGSITSTVSVNATAGFSIVTYTGTGSAATVGHGLGVTPSMVIVKNRTNSGHSWAIRHISLTSTQNLALQSTDAAYTVSSATSNGGVGTLTSTTFSFISGTVGYLNVNASSNNYVAYCWAAIPGYSAFGSYTGNGSADGPFIATNFAPKFVMIKVTSISNVWLLIDTSRSPYNVANLNLNANDSTAENTASTGAWLDFLSNGFKIRNGTDGAINTNGNTYIYACFASNPFKSSNAR